MHPVNCHMMGQLIAELLEEFQRLADETSDVPALRAEGYEPERIDAIEFVAGDYSRIRLCTSAGKQFLICVKQHGDASSQ